MTSSHSSLERFNAPPWVEPPRRAAPGLMAMSSSMGIPSSGAQHAGGVSSSDAPWGGVATVGGVRGESSVGIRTAPLAVNAAHVSRTYGSGGARVSALRDVSLQIPVGTFVAVMGPSGSGKSTLVHCLAGLDVPDSNPETTIVVGGQDITGLSDDQLTRFRRDHVGFVFQAFNLVPTLTARQNIELPLSLAGKDADPEMLRALCETLGITERLEHRPDEMSGGQQQRVAIARALLSQPDVVIADEPTGALDSATSAEVLALLRRCVDELHQTVVVVTHDATVAEAADRVVRVRDGRIVADDAPAGEL